MKKILIAIFLCSILIFTCIPTLQALQPIFKKPGENNNEVFSNCYIVSSGDITFTFQLTDFRIGLQRELILYWPIIFNEPDVEVAIYAKKGGEVLWQNNVDEDQWVLHLIGFRGIYNNDGSTMENLRANLDGKAACILIEMEGK
jgi:hypothetical protein